MGKEKELIRNPFGKAVDAGEIPGWEGSTVLKSVVLDPRWREGEKKGMASQADLVLVKPGKGIAVVECKQKKDAKHAALEQVLMYGEMAQTVGPEQLAQRLRMAKVLEGCKAKDDEVVLRTVEAMEGQRNGIHHMVVVERWGSKALPNTLGLTARLINRALEKVDVPGVQIYAMDEARFISR